MIKNMNTLTSFDMEQFSSDIEELKQEILNNSDQTDPENEDAVILEVIDVLQEEIEKRGKSKKKDIQSEVRFIAYLNLFTTIMDGGFEDEQEDSEFDEEDEYEDSEFEDEEE